MSTININSYDTIYEVELTRATYPYNGNLAIMATTKLGELFGTLTVNTDYLLPPMFAAVDVNNMPCIDKQLVQEGFATETGMMIESGWCQYPVLKFDLDKIPEI